jgi:hypothetical protein
MGCCGWRAAKIVAGVRETGYEGLAIEDFVRVPWRFQSQGSDVRMLSGAGRLHFGRYIRDPSSRPSRRGPFFFWGSLLPQKRPGSDLPKLPKVLVSNFQLGSASSAQTELPCHEDVEITAAINHPETPFDERGPAPGPSLVR